MSGRPKRGVRTADSPKGLAGDILDEEALVREARQVARRLGRQKKALEALIGRAEGLLAVRAEESGPKPPLAAALPYVVKMLRKVFVDVETAWVDLRTAFSTWDLNQEVRLAENGRDEGQAGAEQPRPTRARRRRVVATSTPESAQNPHNEETDSSDE